MPEHGRCDLIEMRDWLYFKVLYPELESHPQHKIHKKQAKGMSGMVSFYLKGGLEESREFLSNLKVRLPRNYGGESNIGGTLSNLEEMR